VTDEKEPLQPPQLQDGARRCPTCAAFPRLRLQYLNPVRGKTIRLYECGQCGERIWDD
jgi:hypothetical protein